MDTLDDLIPSVRNVVARPGTFPTLFPETTDDDLLLVLRDGLAEAQLFGLLTTIDATDDGGLVTAEDETVTADISNASGAVIVLFAGARLITAELMNRAYSRRYRAGAAEFEEVQSAQLLQEILKSLEARKNAVIDVATRTGPDAAAGAAFHMADTYGVRTSGLDLFFDPLMGW